MPISAGLREDIAVYRGFIGQQYIYLSFMVQLSSFVRPTNQNYTYCGLMTDLGLTEEPEK